MKTVPLGEVARFIRGVTFKPDDVAREWTDNAVGVMRTKNVQQQLDLSDVVYIPRALVHRDDQLLRPGDTLISSANSWNIVGKCCWVPALEELCAIGGFVTGLRVSSDLLDARYLYRWLSSPHTQGLVRGTANQTTNIANLNLSRCQTLEIPLPSLDEQRRIAAILDHADALQSKRRQIIRRFSHLEQSVFENSFGEELRNATVRLEEVADVSSGITKGRKTSDSTKPIHYLAVANVQAGHLELGHVKQIDATDSEIKRYALAYGDLVLTEGGDPDKLGRGTVWRNELPLCLHQNHIFRVRVKDEQLEPEYLSAYLASRAATDYFLRAAKQTTGIASINMTQLRNTPIYAPPKEEQQMYLRRIREIAAVHCSSVTQANMLDTLFSSLQTRAFRGEL